MDGGRGAKYDHVEVLDREREERSGRGGGGFFQQCEKPMDDGDGIQCPGGGGGESKFPLI